MKIKGHISFSKHNLLYDDMETCAGGDDCEIEIDDEELDRVVKLRSCNHVYGYRWDNYGSNLVDNTGELEKGGNRIIFAYCPKCGERLIDE